MEAPYYGIPLPMAGNLNCMERTSVPKFEASNLNRQQDTLNVSCRQSIIGSRSKPYKRGSDPLIFTISEDQSQNRGEENGG